MKMEIREFGQEEWYKIVSDFEELSLMQTWEYAEAKAKVSPWKVTRAIFLQENKIVAATQGLMRTIPFLNRGLVWINRAPLWRKLKEDGNSIQLAGMLQELRRYWVEEKKMYLRIAPPILDDEESGLILTKAGFAFCNPSLKWTSARIDLTKTEEELRKGLKQKWRNCLNKAERLGLSFEFGVSPWLMEELVDEYRKMFQSKNLKSTVSPEFIKTLQNLLPDEKKMWVFTGIYNSERLGSILIAPYGDTCEYLVGAVNEIGKKYNTGQFLLWHAICEMKKLGYKWFDVGGADPEGTPPGILHFKEGMGGKPYKLVGELEAYKRSFFTEAIRWRVNRVVGNK